MTHKFTCTCFSYTARSIGDKSIGDKSIDDKSIGHKSIDVLSIALTGTLYSMYFILMCVFLYLICSHFMYACVQFKLYLLSVCLFVH